ncbi:TonB family protein [Paraflavitalea soli]|uniref:TonB family protein n=1 Tax=Paraflavitalea soli TaxID=2315862 RepID=A0A3B7MSI4_9BACT|nr:energy transducer TonB [Paraflavitalea soli]AXY77504.1 TonB family protein [Paraflavitalea soli]
MRSRQLLLTILLVMAITNLYSQVSLKDYSTKVSDTCWRVDYYIPAGSLNKVESFKDRKKTIAHGRFVFYDEKGYADSTGFYVNGQRNGTWYYYNNKGKVLLSREYENGIVVSEKKHEQEPEGKDKSPKPGEVESEFEGGLKGWQQYLNRNLRYPREAIIAGIQGEVRVAFVVSAVGAVQDIWIIKSIDRSLDKESARLLEDSPNWIPAEQDGRRVKSYKIQPIRYRTQ